MRRLLLVALLLAGCGGAVEERTVPTEVLTVGPQGTAGPLVRVQAPTGERHLALTGGVATADGRSYVKASGGQLLTYDARSGRLVGRRPIEPAWDVRAASVDGSYVALAARMQPPGATELAVAGPGGALTRIHLAGRFDVDGLDPDGVRLYLIERFAGHGYAVRSYDLRTGELEPGQVRLKGEEEEEMVGVPGQQVATSDGEWLLTLLTNTEERKAFVHALNMRDRYARCLDLPGEGDADAARGYTLALARSGGALYAPNATLGVVVRLDLAQGSVDSVAFDSGAGIGPTTAAVAADGSTLAFASGGRLWSFDTARERLHGPAELDDPAPPLAVSADGARIYAVGSTLAGFDAVTGERL